MPSVASSSSSPTLWSGSLDTASARLACHKEILIMCGAKKVFFYEPKSEDANADASADADVDVDVHAASAAAAVWQRIKVLKFK